MIASCFNWSRPQLVTRGCEAFEVTPLRDGVGQPGFLMNEEGFVTELQRFCYAESGGLQLWARVVRLCGHSLVHLSTEERTRLLRTAHKIHITVIPPDENGKPRRWVASAEGRLESGRKQNGSRQTCQEKRRGSSLGGSLLMTACSHCHTSWPATNQCL